MAKTEDQDTTQPERQRGQDIGAGGKTVAANVAHYRKRAGLTLAQVVERLGDAGHTLGVSALSKIEQTKRRVDIDDLIALGHALRVAPAALIEPRSFGALPSASEDARAARGELDRVIALYEERRRKVAELAAEALRGREAEDVEDRAVLEDLLLQARELATDSADKALRRLDDRNEAMDQLAAMDPEW